MATPRRPFCRRNRISKSFGEIPVLFSVDFDIRPGEVHAMIGENGAGKSTLIKILSGIEQPTSGSIMLSTARPWCLPPNGEAEAMGIVLIHQEFNLAEHLTVAEIHLSRPRTERGSAFSTSSEMRRARRGVMRNAACRMSTPMRASTRCRSPTSRWWRSPRRISRDARVLIMDEPTAVLSVGETAILFEQIRRLTARGRRASSSSRTSSTRSWSWPTASPCCATAQLVATVGTEALTPDSIAQMMVGRELSNLYPPKHEPDVDAPVVLSVRNLVGRGVVSDISFDLRRGEILGFAGLDRLGPHGAWWRRLSACAHAQRRRDRGRWQAGQFRDGSAKSVDAGHRLYDQGPQGSRACCSMQGLQPEPDAADAQEASQARLPRSTPSEDAALRTRSAPLRHPRARRLGVASGSLSGGNQQKLMLAKTMESRARHHHHG